MLVVRIRDRGKQAGCRAVAIAATFLVTSALAACGRNEYAPPPPPSVTVRQPVERDVVEYVAFTGTTAAVKTVELQARVEGFLEEINYEPGAVVEKDTLLFLIDPKPLAAELDRVQGELAKRQAELAVKSATLERKEQALKTRAVSEVTVIEARADRDMAAAAVAEAQAAVETAELELAYTEVRAPFSGRMSRNYVDVGNLVGAGETTLLATIVDDDPMYVYFSADERTLMERRSPDDPDNRMGHAEPGQFPAFLGLAHEDGYPHEGWIDYVDPMVDPTTGTVTARAVFPNAKGYLVPGLFARVRIPRVGSRRGLLITETAIGADQNGQYVLVVDSDDVVEQRLVTAGQRIDGMRVIDKGVQPGEWIVVDGIQRARPGAKVAPQRVDAGAPKPTPAEPGK